MARNEVTLGVRVDDKQAVAGFKNVGSAAKGMAGDLDKAESEARQFGSSMDSVGSAVGGTESKFMGTADLLDGLGSAFGLPLDGAVGLTRAFGDLSGGFEVVQGFLTSGVGKMKDFAAAILQSSTVTKAWTGIQTAFNAVMNMNPAIAITTAVIALGAALVIAYQKSETFRNIVQGAFRIVKDAAEDVWNFIAGLADGIWGVATAIKDALIWPYKTAFNLIAKFWNNSVGQLSFKVPSWVPGIGGKGFEMPKLPTFFMGGVVPGSPGSAVPIMAHAGETVVRAGQSTGDTVIINAGTIVSESQLADLVQKVLLRKQARTGPLGFA